MQLTLRPSRHLACLLLMNCALHWLQEKNKHIALTQPSRKLSHSKMFYALDASTCSWLHASHATRDGQYTCDCPDRHPVCLKLPSGRENVEYRTPHFSHLPKSNTECRGGGESAEHKAAKHRLREMRGQYSFVMETCPECKGEMWETCSNGTVGIEVRSADGRWWYDCVYKSDGYEIALEVFHTHATTQEKIKATRQSGMQLAEFHADEVNAMEPGAELHNLQIVSRICGQRCEDAGRRRIEEARSAEIARKWQELKRYTEAERAEIISDARSRRGDRAKILARWADLKAWRKAERAILLSAWRDNLARGV